MSMQRQQSIEVGEKYIKALFELLETNQPFSKRDVVLRVDKGSYSHLEKRPQLNKLVEKFVAESGYVRTTKPKH